MTSKRRVRAYSPAQKALKAVRRRIHRAEILNRLIRNATARAKTQWDSGLFGGLQTSQPTRTLYVPSHFRRCHYAASMGKNENVYEIRFVRTNWCPLLAVWGLHGIVCIPFFLVHDGHHADAGDPGQPPLCQQCDASSWNCEVCMQCGAPMYYPP